MFNNIHLNPFAISNLLIVLTCFPLAIVIFIYGKTKLSKIYCLHVISLGVWGFGAFFASSIIVSNISYIWWLIAYSGVIIIPVFFLHVVCILSNRLKNPLLLFSYIQAIVFLVLNFMGLIFKENKFMFNSFYYAQGNFLHYVSFFIWSIIVITEYYLLIRLNFRNKNRSFMILFLIATIGYGGGLMNFFPAFGFNIYPWGNFTVPIYLIVITWAIFKYQVFEVNVAFQKSFIYSILIALITATYFIFVFLAEKLFQGMVGYTSLFISIIYAFVIALFFNPVKNKIQYFADKIFLGKTPIQIAKENELLRQELLRAEKLKTIATFASGMAHEIKNPLTAIKTFSEYLPQKIGDKEFMQKFSHIVSSEVEKIDDLVHQLLDFSKPAPLQLKEADIHRLIDDTLELLSSQFIKYKINVTKDYCDYKMIAVIDTQKMKQVFLNLFLNAIEAMPAGGNLTITIRVNSEQLTDNSKQVTAQTRRNFIEISVSDTGCGISDKDMPHIFEPFHTTKEKGSGLGLSIVYNIIKEHKGSIKVKSKLKEGTKFIIELPKA
ncbi:MAG: ATP-binding protein [Candidatus Omnitrophica bacterium]|nr:ATP-binding protein [Candidatus Omnitrophota bacterium]MDD5352245.1 ATP-binding protein [Candidatus Omnitrophota bacterium]MDD5549843.1 ATP-binding protein [Candidatus Omnitrophota bacterium]